MKNIIEKLNWRYAVKRYDPDKKVSREDMDKLQETIRLAPSSFGLQPYKVLFIEDAALREKLSVASFNQPQITEGHSLIVFAIETQVDEAYVDACFANICSSRNVTLDGNLLKHRNSVMASVNRMAPAEKLTWATHQAYLALGFLLLAAADLGIDANPMEGFMPAQYNQIMGLPQHGLHAVVIAALGYRSENDFYQRLPKVRKPAEELFIHL